MEKSKDELFDGLRDRGWNEEQLATLWQDMIDYSSYSFNKSHSSAYAIIAFQMAKLKVYYPLEFMIALLNSIITERTDIAMYIDECKQMGIEVLPPDINKSKAKFTKEGNAIRFGLQAIKSVGLPTIETIEKIKSTQLMLTDGMSDEFFGFEDFYNVMEVMIQESQYEDEDGISYEENGLPKDAIIALIKSGAFGMQRNQLLYQYAEMLYTPLVYKERKTLPSKKDIEKLGVQMSEVDYKDKEKRASIFNERKYAEYIEKNNTRKQRHLDEFAEKYIRNEKFYDFDTMACYLQLSPFDDYMNRLTNLHDYENGESKIIIMGTILEKEVKKASRGGQYAKLSMITPFGVYFGKCYSAQYTEFKDILEKGQTVVALVKKSNDEFIISKMLTFKEWKDNLERKKEAKRKRAEFLAKQEERKKKENTKV